MPDGNGVQILDYKTSTSVQTAEKAKSKTTGSNQLVMYALAWRLLHDEDPISVCLDFVQTGQLGVVKKRSDSLDKIQVKLTQAAQDILDGKFPLGVSHDFCIHPL
jgi:RecB family exonuclease